MPGRHSAWKKSTASGQFAPHEGKVGWKAEHKVVNYVDNYLKDAEKGQYFITINKSEVEETDLEDFRKKKMIVAEFDREHGDEHRFFGCKY